MKSLLTTLILSLLFGLLTNKATSQSNQSFPEEYNSLYEYEVVTDSAPSNLEIFLAGQVGANEIKFNNVQQTLNEFFEKLREEEVHELSAVKKIKEIHKAIHATFLKKYEAISDFNRIFELGEYNCLSATALLALTLEEFDIPYNIQELPTHVYIIAYPSTKGITVEMTAPKEGYYVPGRRDISKAVDILREYKLVDASEIKEKGDRAIYNEYYYKDQTINLRELAGLQYFNQTIIEYEESAYEKALNSISKSEYLYPSDKTILFKVEVLSVLLDDAKFNNMKSVRYMKEYANLTEVDHNKIIYEYARALQVQLIEHGKRKFIDSSYHYLSTNLKDSILREKISEIYFVGMAEYYSNAYNLKKQLEYIEKAHEINPENVTTQLHLTRSIIRVLHDKYEPEELVVQMDSFANKYPFLKNHNFYKMFYFYSYAEISNEYYIDNDEDNGHLYFERALEMRSSMEDDEVLDQDFIGMLYAEKATYYYRLKKYEKAIEIYDEGLEYAPEHRLIVMRRKNVVNKLNASKDKGSSGLYILD